MNAQLFLALLRDHYTFNQAQSVLSNLQIKGLWESWFSGDMLHALSSSKRISDVIIDCPYPAQLSDEQNANAGNVKSKATYLSVKANESQAKLVEKRHGSRADFAFSAQGERLYCEGFCTQAHGQLSAKDIRRMRDLLQRSKKLKAQNASLNIVTFSLVSGFIESGHMTPLKPLDNSKTLSYVLDTHIQGSSSIARLSAISNVKQPRILVIASSA